MTGDPALGDLSVVLLRVLPKWPKIAVEEVAQGIYEMEAAFEARRKQQKKVDDAIADIRRKLRSDPSISDEQLDDLSRRSLRGRPLHGRCGRGYTAWAHWLAL
jgi:type II secretory pathway component PulM